MENTTLRIGEEKPVPVKKTPSLWQYPLLACAYALLSFAKSGMINCFAESFFVATSLFAPAFVLLPIYGVTTLLYLGETKRLIVSLVIALCTAITATCCKKMKSRFTLVAVFIVASLVKTASAFITARTSLDDLINGILLPCIAYPLYIALNGVYNKPVGYRQSALELGCTAFLVAVLSCAVASGGILYPAYALGSLLLALVTAVYGKGAGVICAISVGAGIALYTFNAESIAFFAFISVVYCLFSSAPRALAGASLVLGAIAFKLLFSSDLTDALAQLISLTVGGVAYCVIPRSVLNKAKKSLCSPFDKSGMRYLVASGRATSAVKIQKVSKVFGEMSKALLPVKEGSIDYESVARSVSDAVCSKCGKCDEKERFHAICELLNISENNGRATVNELSYFLQVNCNRIAHLISLGADYAQEVKRAKKRASEEDELRAEMARSFDGVREILEQTAIDLSINSLYGDGKTEELLVEELRSVGVVVLDALTFTGKISVVVAGDTSDDDIANRISKIMKSEYTVERVEKSAGVRVITVRERTPFDAVFAVSSLSKSKDATGDTHSFIRISDTKFMMALCDGMGSGKDAGAVSESAISLVENFYKAGFSSQFVIESVNRFLAYRIGESFVAFDILVCDLNSLERTMIKMGSPASYIKGEEGVIKLEGNALPLGALGEITPCVFTDVAQEGQTVLFLSDGVSDRINANELASLVASLPSHSVQKIADAVLEKAVSAKNGAISDDMTVLAVKVSRRI